MSNEHRTPAGKVPFDYAIYMADVTNRDLARKTGINESDISRFRRGLRPDAKKAAKLAKALGKTQAELGWEQEAQGV